MFASSHHGQKGGRFDPHLNQLRAGFGDVDRVLGMLCAHPFFHLDNQTQQDLSSLKKAFDHLRALVVDLYLVTADESSGDLWSKYRHDLRSYVGGIKGYAELLLEDMGENADESVRLNLSDLIIMADGFLPIIDRMRFDPPANQDQAKEKSTNYLATKYPSLILVIDDSPHKRDVLKRRLTQVGHQVVMADDGAAGLKTLEEYGVDLILLDILMPGMNGYDVLNALKKNPKTTDIPVLMISSVSEIESVATCIAAGADDYLPVPINPIVLHARINRCLERQDLARRERQNQDQLNEARLNLEKALASMQDGFAIFDGDDYFRLCNQSFIDLYPTLANRDIKTVTYRDFLQGNLIGGLYQEERRRSHDANNPDGDDDFVPVKNQRQWIDRKLADHQNPTQPYLQRLSNNRWVEVVESKIPGGGTVVVHKNVTDRVLQDKRMVYLANHDPLTGLANRSLFEKNLRDTLEASQKNRLIFALYYIDVDRFKSINDTFGHDAGDYLLKEVARRLEQSVRTTDSVARLGGDEFCVIARALSTPDEGIILAQRIIDNMTPPVLWNDQTLSFGISMGIAIYPRDGTSGPPLVKAADAAMYKAKKTGDFSYILFHDMASETQDQKTTPSISTSPGI